MDNYIYYSLLAVFAVSAVSLVGVVILTVNHKVVAAVSALFVSFAVGALLGDTFIHLLPEAENFKTNDLQIPLSIIAGMLIFFVLEKFIRWKHKHFPLHKEEHQPVAIMNIVGDGVHNLIDGFIIASSFMAGPAVGLSTTIAVVLHEIPQEISDFAILIHAKWPPKKALLFNFLTALTSFVGAGIALLLGGRMLGDQFLTIALPLTAGGFIYIAASDLIPDLHEKVDIKNSLMQIIFILLGIIVMMSLLFLE